MKFIAIINRDIKLGEALNALGHMTLGLGHRLNGEPDVDVYFGSTDQVREFRTLATKISMEHQNQVVRTDFPHTMSGVSSEGKSDEQVNKTATTTEAAMTYFGSCFIAEEIDSRLLELTKSCSQLVGYVPYSSKNKATLLPPKENQPYSGDVKKMSMLINTKLPISQTINSVVLTSLNVGQKAEFSELYLLNLEDKDGNRHGNISYHPFAILKADSPAKQNTMADNAEKTKNLVAKTLKNENNQPLVTLVFGNESEIEKVILRKQTRLYNDTLKEEELKKMAASEAVEKNKSNTSFASKEEEKAPAQVKNQTNEITKNKIAFIGAGNIASSLIGGLIQNGYPKSNIVVSNRSQEKLQKLTKTFDIQAAQANTSAVENADVVVIAVDSRSVPKVAKEIANVVKQKKPLIVCLSSGIRVQDLEQWLDGSVNIVRVMTNTTSSVRAAGSALFANQATTQHQKEIAEFLFNAIGKSIWVDAESKLDSITSLVGCGPAYLFLLLEAMEKAAINQGVTPEVARSMAIQSVYGAVTIAQNTSDSVAELRKKITTPGGVTEASLKPLLEGGIFQLFESAFKSGEIRCKELSETLGKNGDLNSTPAVTDFFKKENTRQEQSKQEVSVAELSS